MSKAIVPFQEKCTGCRICEQTCSLRHFKVLNPMRSRIQIHKMSLETDLPVICNHGIACNKECIDVCPVNCIVMEGDIVKIVEADCISCKACVSACPYDSIHMHDAVAIKCDLCGGGPECVQVCSLGAIRYDSGPKERFDHVRKLAGGR